MRNDKTAEVLDSMLKENTGAHFLDSGGAYGRNHERNQGKDFERTIPTTLSFRYGDIDVTHNVYHFCKEHLTWDEEGNHALAVMKRFIRLSNWRDERRSGSYVDENGAEANEMELRELFASFFRVYKARKDEADREECPHCDGEGSHDDTCDSACSEGGAPCGTCYGRGWYYSSSLHFTEAKGFTVESPYEATGIYGDGEPIDVNTYNEENLLSQTLLFNYFELEKEGYVVLQVHGGCDVRGGYTDPQVFTTGRFDDTGFFNYKNATIYCTLPGIKTETDPADHYWTTDDGSHYYAQGSCGMGAERQLEKYEKAVIDPEHFDSLCQDSEDPEAELQEDGKTTYVRGWTRGVLCYTQDDVTLDNGEKILAGTGFCPHCGGQLGAGY